MSEWTGWGYSQVDPCSPAFHPPGQPQADLRQWPQFVLHPHTAASHSDLHAFHGPLNLSESPFPAPLQSLFSQTVTQLWKFLTTITPLPTCTEMSIGDHSEGVTVLSVVGWHFCTHFSYSLRCSDLELCFPSPDSSSAHWNHPESFKKSCCDLTSPRRGQGTGTVKRFQVILTSRKV